MTHKEYNGWTNYETWNANLWLSNDEGSDNLCREMAQDAYNDVEGGDTREAEATSALADGLKSLFDDQMDDGDAPVAGWMADAINLYISEVDWYEIAEHYIEDLEKEDVESEGVGQ